MFGDGRDFSIYIFGGFYDDDIISNKVLRLSQQKDKNLACFKIEELIISSSIMPCPRYYHEAVPVTSDEMFMFGGVVTPSGLRCNKLWKLKLLPNHSGGEWSVVNPASSYEVSVEDNLRGIKH